MPGEEERRGWDTRAWLVGILGGAVGGSVTAWATYPSVTRRLNAAIHFSGAAGIVIGVLAVAGLLVLPGVISGIARRRTFLWGLLPTTLFLAVISLKNWSVNGPRQVAATIWVIPLIMGISLILSSGPVSLIRYLRVRARRRCEAALASLIAQREAASVPQEGVWPPPPDYRENLP